jgi:hypothetical protein
MTLYTHTEISTPTEELELKDVKILDFTRRQNDHRHTFDEGKQEQYGSRLGEKGEKKGGEKAEIEVRE